MKNIFTGLLKRYREEEYLLYQKAKTVLSLNLAIIALLSFAILYTLLIQVKIITAVLVPEIVLLICYICFLFLLSRGYFRIASHGIIILSMSAVWIIMSARQSHLLNQLDTIAFLYGVLAMTSLTTIRNKKVILLYGASNIIVLYVFMWLFHDRFALPVVAIVDYLLDNTVGIALVTFIAYKIFSINQKSLERANLEINRRKISEETIIVKNRDLEAAIEELEATNEELQATMEELEASNEEFEVTNEELSDAYRELEESELKLRNILKVAPVGIISVKNRTVLWASDYFFEMLQYAPDEIIGKDAALFFASEDDYRRTGSYTAEAIDRKTKVEVETRYRKKDGTVFEVLLSGSALNPEDPETSFIVIAVDISALKGMEESLLESEEKFRTIAEQSLIGVVMVQNGMFSFVNRAVSEINGFSEDEMLAWTPEEYAKTIHPEDLPRVLELSRKKQAGEIPYTGSNQWRMLTKSGTTRWVETSSSPVTLGGRPAMLTTIIDITDRINSEQEHLERLHSLETLERIESAMRSTLDLDRMMKETLTLLLDIYQCDRAWFFFPATPETKSWRIPMVVSRPDYRIDELINKDNPMSEDMGSAISLVMKAGKPVIFSDEEEAPWVPIMREFDIRSMIVIPVYPRLGQPWLMGLHQCSSSRKWTESEMHVLGETAKRLSDALSSLLFFRDLLESEDRLRTMIDTAPYPIAMSKTDGTISYVNHTFVKVFGYTLDNLETLDQWWQLAYPDPEYRSKVQAVWEKETMEAHRQNRPIHPMEYIVTCKDGTRRHVEFRMVPIGDTAFVVMDDLTEKKLTQEMMIQSEKMMTVGSLAAGMAHEINNPLGIILQGIQNTLRRIDPASARNRSIADELNISADDINAYLSRQNIITYLEGIREAGSRAARIVASMLQFSRKSDSEMKLINMNMLIDETLEIVSQDYDLKKSYDFKKISINKNYDTSIPSLRCIVTEIEQVILNLLKNAAQAMSEIRDPDYVPKISISTFTENSQIVLIISDNGPGIEEEILKHIFEPFFTTKSVGSGTGLGLSVSYFIITNNHNGTITADSLPGEGTTFTIRIPSSGRNS